MVGGAEGIGEAVTGGLLARAVEPGAGESGELEGGICLNCGSELGGRYCHRCGQPAHVHRTLGAFWHDLAHGVLHFEGKIWRTLPLLAWRPGELTRRYVRGERARFVSPIALFLFSVFLMFAVFSILVGTIHTGDPVGAGQTAEQIEHSRKVLGEDLAQLRERRAKAVARRAPAAAIEAMDEGIKDTEAELEALESAQKALGTRSLVKVMGSQGVTLGWFEAALKKAKENPDLLIYKLQSNGYKVSWALIPISVPFVWLLFLHRRRYREYRAYDHVVFVTYSLAFMSLLAVALSLFGRVGIGGGFIAFGALLIPPLHMYRQLKGAYSLSRFSAIWRTAMLTFFALIAAMLFMLLLLTIGVSG
jgi:hypothetical protein